MDKKAIKEQLTELENNISQAKEKANELRKLIDQPERWEPKELTWAWVSSFTDKPCEASFMRVIPVTFRDGCYRTRLGTRWTYATPLTAEEIVKFSGGLVLAVQVVKKSRYDWSNAPEGTKFITTDCDGRIDYWHVKPYINGTKWYGDASGPISYTRPEPAEVVIDWRYSLESSEDFSNKQ
jgi:hypothetical protein